MTATNTVANNDGGGCGVSAPGAAPRLRPYAPEDTQCAVSGRRAHDAVQRQFHPAMLDVDALVEALVELVSLPESPDNSACILVKQMESCG